MEYWPALVTGSFDDDLIERFNSDDENNITSYCQDRASEGEGILHIILNDLSNRPRVNKKWRQFKEYNSLVRDSRPLIFYQEVEKLDDLRIFVYERTINRVNAGQPVLSVLDGFVIKYSPKNDFSRGSVCVNNALQRLFISNSWPDKSELNEFIESYYKFISFVLNTG